MPRACMFDRIVGCYARRRDAKVLCGCGGMLVAGSRAKMRRYLRESGQAAVACSIHSLTFTRAVMGLFAGDAVSLDRQAYSRFRPLAQAVGLLCGEIEFDRFEPAGAELARIELLPEFRAVVRHNLNMMRSAAAPPDALIQ